MYHYLLGAVDDTIRMELRFAGSVSQYKATQAGATGGATYFHRDKSRFERAVFSLGVRGSNGPDLLGWVAAGAVVQHEAYSAIDTTAANLFNYDSRLGGAFEIRAAVLWRFARPFASVRLGGYARYFQLTRQVVTLAQSGAVGVAGGLFETIEAETRLLLTADVAQVFGIAPGVFVGLDYLAIGRGAGSAAATVPLGGVGLVSIGN